MKKAKKIISLMLVFVLAMSTFMVFPDTVEAASTPKFKLSSTSLTLSKNSYGKLSVIENDTKNDYKVVWSSSKSSVASVNTKGLVTAKKVGKATITAKVYKKNGSKKLATLYCSVTVNSDYVKVHSNSNSRYNLNVYAHYKRYTAIPNNYVKSVKFIIKDKKKSKTYTRTVKWSSVKYSNDVMTFLSRNMSSTNYKKFKEYYKFNTRVEWLESLYKDAPGKTKAEKCKNAQATWGSQSLKNAKKDLYSSYAKLAKSILSISAPKDVYEIYDTYNSFVEATECVLDFWNTQLTNFASLQKETHYFTEKQYYKDSNIEVLKKNSSNLSSICSRLIG